MKRSKAVNALILGTSVFALSACQEQTEVSFVEDIKQCYAAASVDSANFTEGDCDEAFAAAMNEHRQSAPRYDALEVCEEQHGVGRCDYDSYNTAGGSSFVPFFAGYMLGNMMNSSSSVSKTYGRPLYSTASGRYTTADGRSKISSLGGSTLVSPATLTTRAAVTQGKPPMTRAAVQSRGGFGVSRTSGGTVRAGG